MQIANTIKSKKIVDMQAGRFGLQSNKSKDTNFYEYFYNIADKKDNPASIRTTKTAINTFREFAGEHITFNEITEKFCKKYQEYLQNKSSQ